MSWTRDLVGRTRKIGGEDIEFGIGTEDDTFDVVTPEGSTAQRRRVPSLLPEAASVIKGSYYVSNSPSITDHSATSGADYEAGNIQAVIDLIGSNPVTLSIPFGEYDLGGNTVVVPSHITVDAAPGVNITNGVLTVLGPHIRRYFAPTLAVAQGFNFSFHGQSCEILGRAEPGDGYGGVFVYYAEDLSAEVASDTHSGIYFAVGGGDGSSGAVVRQFYNKIKTAWFNMPDDGETDATAVWQHIVDIGEGCRIIIQKPTISYRIGPIDMTTSNVVYDFEPGVIFEAIDGLDVSDRLFRFYGCTGVTVYGNGGVIKGVGASIYTGEQNHGVHIAGASHLIIYDLVCMDTGGDGFYIGPLSTGLDYSEHIRLYRCRGVANRRQGLSITSGKHILVDSCYFGATVGASPQAGIDIEPNSNNDEIQNIIIKNTTTKNNAGPGIIIALALLPGVVDKHVSILVDNCTDYGSRGGFQTEKLDCGAYALSGTIDFRSVKSCGSITAAYAHISYDVNGPHVRVDGISIYNQNPERVTSSASVYSTICITRDSGAGGADTIGNICIDNIEIYDDLPTEVALPALRFHDADLDSCAKIHVGSIKCIKNKSVPNLADIFSTGTKIDDPGKILSYSVTGTFTLGASSYCRYIDNYGAAGNVFITLSSMRADGPYVTFEVKANHILRITPDSATITPYGTGPGTYMQSDSVGSSVTLYRDTSSTWRIVEIVGVWTYE